MIISREAILHCIRDTLKAAMLTVELIMHVQRALCGACLAPGAMLCHMLIDSATLAQGILGQLFIQRGKESRY
jgi:hypothetical protein